MAKAKIKWNMRAAGRDVGHVETVEIDTVFMQGVIKNRVVTVLEVIEPEPKPVSEAELIGLLKPELPKPKPRAPRHSKWDNVKMAKDALDRGDISQTELRNELGFE